MGPWPYSGLRRCDLQGRKLTDAAALSSEALGKSLAAPACDEVVPQVAPAYSSSSRLSGASINRSMICVIPRPAHPSEPRRLRHRIHIAAVQHPWSFCASARSRAMRGMRSEGEDLSGLAGSLYRIAVMLPLSPAEPVNNNETPIHLIQ